MLGRETIIGVCGAGAMGAGIAQVAALAGHSVIILDQDDAALARGRDTVAKGLSALVKRGKLDEDGAHAIAARCGWTLDAGAMAKAGLVIEAIVESAEIKRALFARLEAVLDAEAVIATNTSSLAVTSLAASLKRPARFMGLHFFNPAPVMKLVEVIRGAETDPGLVAQAKSLMEGWGKIAVIATDVPGFIVNRVARPFYGEGWRALEEGAASAATLDFLYRELAGFRMGPFELGDLIGHDVNFAAAKSIHEAYFGRTRFAPSLAQGRLVAAGRLGRKSGRGVYSYTDEEKPAPELIAPQGAVRDLSLLKAVMAKGEANYEGARLFYADGRSASRAAADARMPAVVIDYLRDPDAATVIAYAASDEKADAAALAFASQSGKSAVRLNDRAGLVVFRTLAQLVNCASDAVRDRVASPEAIDLAMVNGVNYPFGPLAWVNGESFARIASALDVIADETGDAAYRPGEWLRAAARKAL